MTTTTVYRDATYSAATQELLRELLGFVREPETGIPPEHAAALADAIERWDKNDATEIVVEDVTPDALVSGDPKYGDRSIATWDVNCPGCSRPLEWGIETPPIPMTFYSWFDPNGDGQRINFCPGCDEELPQGDLTKKEETR